MVVHDFVGLRIHFKHTNARVHIRQRRDGGREKRDTDSLTSLGRRAARITIRVGIKHAERVFVRVCKEHVRNCVLVSRDDLVEQVRGAVHRAVAVPAGEHMPNDPNTLIRILCTLQFVGDPAQRATVVGVRGVDEGEAVAPVPKVGVERDDA